MRQQGTGIRLPVSLLHQSVIIEMGANFTQDLVLERKRETWHKLRLDSPFARIQKERSQGILFDQT